MNVRTLPVGWTWATLPDLVGPNGLITDGDWVESKDQDPDGDVRLTQLADIGDGVFRDRSNRYMTKDAAKRLSCTFLVDGDVLVARMPDPLGRSCLYPGGPSPAVTVVDVCIIRPSANRVDHRWLMNFINAPAFRNAIDALEAGTTRKRISKKNLSTIPLPTPPLKEQHRIVEALDSYLSRLDDAIANLERVRRNLGRYRSSVLQAAVEGRLVPTEAELAKAEGRTFEPASVLLRRILAERRKRWEASGKKGKYEEPVGPDTTGLPELPEGWCWGTPRMLAQTAKYSLAIGPFGSNLRVPDYRAAGVPLVFVRNVRSGTYAGLGDKFVEPGKAAELVAHRVRAGDVVITKMGEPPGDADLYPPGSPDAIITADVIKWSVDPSVFVARYAVYATGSKTVKRQILGVTQGVAQQKISLERFQTVAYPLPPLAEQNRIIAEADRLLSIAAKTDGVVEIQRARCIRLRQSILKWAFEGKLVDQDPNDEPAELTPGRSPADGHAAIRRHRVADATVNAEGRS